MPPGEEVASFDEYALLYREAWGDPLTRWVLSTVSSAMVWDDHEVHDDWNTSASWVAEMRRKPWWEERIAGAIATYWLYQHLGNLSPALLEQDDLLRRVREADDGWELLREFAVESDREVAGVLWSFERDLGHSRLLTVDSRGGRVLEGTREMVDDNEWQWIVERATGDLDHLVIATSLPFLLPPGAHGLEAWSEAVADGAWGKRLEPLGEKARRALDLEHWAAFGDSFRKLARLLTEVADGRRGKAPATVLVLSGDVHYSYLAARRARGHAARTDHVLAAPEPDRPQDAPGRPLRRLARGHRDRADAGAARAGAEPELDWRLDHGPWFDNMIATLELRGREARLRIEKTLPRRPRAAARARLRAAARLAPCGEAGEAFDEAERRAHGTADRARIRHLATISRSNARHRRRCGDRVGRAREAVERELRGPRGGAEPAELAVDAARTAQGRARGRRAGRARLRREPGAHERLVHTAAGERFDSPAASPASRPAARRPRPGRRSAEDGPDVGEAAVGTP